jgi:hypothetical protein
MPVRPTNPDDESLPAAASIFRLRVVSFRHAKLHAIFRGGGRISSRTAKATVAAVKTADDRSATLGNMIKRTVFIEGKAFTVCLTQRTERSWSAVGERHGHTVRAQGVSRSDALLNWRDAAAPRSACFRTASARQA